MLLKLSGEALGGEQDYGIDFAVVRNISKQIKRVHEMNVQVALVIGGGNIFRGMAAAEGGFDAPPATTWACLRPSSTLSPSRRASNRWAPRPGP